MAVEYPNVFNLRLTDEDLRQLQDMSKKLDMPRSTLVRQVWREWLIKALDTRSPQPATQPRPEPRKKRRQKARDTARTASTAVVPVNLVHN